ncbi:RNA polymerase sigma factor [bacterium]|nr:RNA polymerase sigma factor [bacterium]
MVDGYFMPEGGSGGAMGAGSPLSREVLSRVCRREPEALGVLFEACFDRVYGLALRMMGQPAAAEDIAQEVFLRVHRSADTLDPDRDPLSWILTITGNLCRDHHRSFAAKVARGSGTGAEEDGGRAERLAGGDPGPEERTLANERERVIQEAILALPEQLREVVLLRDYEGLDHNTIADMLGTTSTAVRKRYSRALAQLGEMLEGEWP